MTKLLPLLLRLLLSRPAHGSSAEQADGTEALHTLARAAFDFEQSRYDQAEAKAARYLTILGLIFAGAAIKNDDLLWTLRHTALSWYWRSPFLVVYGATFVVVFWAVLLSIRAMAVKDVPALPLDHRLRDLFRDHPRSAAMNAMADAFFDEAKALRTINDGRGRDLSKISWLLKCTLWMAAASLILYIPLRLYTPETSSASNSGGITSMAKPTTPSTSPQPSSAPASTSTPQAPKFDTIKRGDTTPHEQATQKSR